MSDQTPFSEIDTAPYRLRKEIGRGAYGVVYLAEGPEGPVALKICRRPLEGDGRSFEREQEGLTAYSRIPGHRGLIRIHSLVNGPAGDYFYYVMDLADDELSEENPSYRFDPGTYRPKTLADVLSAEVALPLQRSIALGIRLTEAVVHLQKHHLVHRDIKPGNVLVVKGEPVLADIGLMADIRDAVSAVGTPGYVPPENHGSLQGDVYSLGMTLCRASTGRSSEERGLAPKGEADMDAPYFRRWMQIVTKATSPVITKRYGSAKALLRDLRSLDRHFRIVTRRKLRVFLFVASIAFLLWCGWNFSVFRTWVAHDAAYRYHVPLPWPYRLLQPFLAPWHDPCRPDSPFHIGGKAPATGDDE